LLPSTSTAGIPTRDGGRWGHGVVRKVLTRTTYIGRHRLNTKVFEEARTKARRRGGRDSMPPIVAASDFEAVQDLLKIGGPALRPCASSAVRHYPQAFLRCKQIELGGYRRDHPRALAQHVEKVRIKGSKNRPASHLVAPATFAGSLIQFLI
jgi:hypothetical protein